MKVKKIVLITLTCVLMMVIGDLLFSMGKNDQMNHNITSLISVKASDKPDIKKMPDGAIKFENIYSDEYLAIPSEEDGGLYYYNDSKIYDYDVTGNTVKKIYEYKDGDFVQNVYPDISSKAFYILKVKRNEAGEERYYVDQFDIKTKQIESTKDFTKFVPEAEDSRANAIGIDKAGRYYLSTYNGETEEYRVHLISKDFKEISSAKSNNIYYFKAFDSTNGNFYFEGYTKWIYWGYSHNTQSLNCGNVKDDKISISDYYIDILYQKYYLQHYDNVAMLLNGDLAWTSTLNGMVHVLKSGEFDINNKEDSIPIRCSITREGYENNETESVGTRVVYNTSNKSIVVYNNGNEIIEINNDIEKISTYKTKYPVFALYNYGDKILVIEKDTDNNYYREVIDWKMPSKITLSEDSINLKVGENTLLTATSNAVIDYDYTWSSEDNAIASVTKDGKIYANKAGTTTITAQTENGTKATCRVTVEKADKSPLITSVNMTGDASTNISQNDYRTWASVIKSYFTENVDHTYTRVENTSKGILVEQYAEDTKKLISQKYIKNELSLFGGYFAGKDNNYIVFGQKNEKEDDEAEVVRVVKYTKNWERVSDCKIQGVNTTEPFDAGSLRMIELDEKLYIYTSHTMYADDEGINHQANLLFTIDESTMKTLDSMYTVSNLGNGYVSHSFNQFIKTDGNYIYRVDHSESNNFGYDGTYLSVNGITLTKYGKNNKSTEVRTTVPTKFDIHNGNYTGVSIGGFEIGSGNCLIAYAQDISRSCNNRNIYVSVTDKNFNKTKIVPLTSYKKEDNTTCKNPHLVKISENLMLVMWEEYNKATQETMGKIISIDSNANIVSNIVKRKFRLSDCQPVYCSDQTVKWYVTDNKKPVLYSVDPYDISKEHVHAYVESNIQQPTCTKEGMRIYRCSVCGEEKTETIKPTGHHYKNNLTPATINEDGKSYQECNICGNKTKEKIIKKISSINISKSNYTYNGKLQTPKVTIKNSAGTNLVNKKDYKITYPSGGKNVGKQILTIQFIGNYAGTYSYEYEIRPKATTIKSLSSKRKTLGIKWNLQKTQVTGYEIQYAKSKDFKKASKVTIKKNSISSKTIKNCSAKKKYYVRIRTYKTLKYNGKSYNIYSTWSRAKNIIVKK